MWTTCIFSSFVFRFFSLSLSLSLASPPLFPKPKKKKLKKTKSKKQNKEFFQCTQSFFLQFAFENEMIKSLSLAIPKAPVAVAVAAAVHHHHHHPHQLPPPLCLVANSLRFSARGGNKVCAQQRCRLVRTMASTPPAGGTKVQKSEEEWRTVLNPEQFRILREKGTEWAGTGEYNKHYDEGVYECAACGTPLYKSTTKFDSGCGWPAFFEGLPGAITETPDADGRRTEITCTACGGHLGHVFRGEGFKTPTDARHCVNSISLNFTPANK